MLRVYQRAIAQGTETNAGAHQIEGLSVSADPDGYTVTISDGQITARLMFHNKIAIEGSNSQRLMRFRARLERAAT